MSSERDAGESHERHVHDQRTAKDRHRGRRGGSHGSRDDQVPGRVRGQVGPAAPVRELHLCAEHLLRACTVDEQLDQLECGAREVGGQHYAERGTQHVAGAAQADGGRHDRGRGEQHVVAGVGVECLVQPLGPVAQAVDRKLERVVERLEHRQRGAQRDRGEGECRQAGRPRTQDAQRFSRAADCRGGSNRRSYQRARHANGVGAARGSGSARRRRWWGSPPRPPAAGRQQGAQVPALGLVATLDQRHVAQGFGPVEPHAVLGVGDPAARGGEQREAGRPVAEPARARHRAPIAAVADHRVRPRARLDEGRDARAGRAGRRSRAPRSPPAGGGPRAAPRRRRPRRCPSRRCGPAQQPHATLAGQLVERARDRRAARRRPRAPPRPRARGPRGRPRPRGRTRTPGSRRPRAAGRARSDRARPAAPAGARRSASGTSAHAAPPRRATRTAR